MPLKISFCVKIKYFSQEKNILNNIIPHQYNNLQRNYSVELRDFPVVDLHV